MYFHDPGPDSNGNEQLLAENSARQQESLTRLQYIIAVLIEKNEQMRQQLASSQQERS